MNICAVFADRLVGEGGSRLWGAIAVDNQRSDQKLILGDRLDLFSANRSKIDPANRWSIQMEVGGAFREV